MRGFHRPARGGARARPVHADFSTSPWPFITLFGAGFGIGVLGHLYGSRLMVGFGIAIVFVATLILPLALSISN